jgi:hypothetical protein
MFKTFRSMFEGNDAPNPHDIAEAVAKLVGQSKGIGVSVSGEKNAWRLTFQNKRDRAITESEAPSNFGEILQKAHSSRIRCGRFCGHQMPRSATLFVAPVQLSP